MSATVTSAPAETDWVVVRVDVSEAAADAVGSFLLDQGAGGLLTDASDSDRPPAGISRLEAHFAAAVAAIVIPDLHALLPHLRSIFPGTTLAIQTSPLPATDWNAVFREHHHPIEIGRRLLVAPPWDVPPAQGREVLVIDPGMAFGTGQHATTRGCLEEIEAAVDAGPVRSALDVGTGSGLLAAALARLGVRTVVAVDNDPAVLAVARDNLDTNGAAHVVLCGGTAAAIEGTFDLVVANLLLDVIVAAAPELAARVAVGGRLILSGLLETQVDTAAAAFPQWRATAVRREAPWATVRLERTD